MSIEIEPAVLEKACKEVIETILLCLPNAYKGTIYRIGKPPELVAERITSGIIDDERKVISWGLPTASEYNPPGRPWVDYRDEPGRPPEAMAWCVETQKSWTADDPAADTRSVRMHVDGVPEDFHHMEPVLLHKSDVGFDNYCSQDSPKDLYGNLLWEDKTYIVAAVVKIHFRPKTIRRNSHETNVIKKLSRSLGTELLSRHLHQDSMNAIHQVARDRLNACNILADSLRNAITKSGLILALVKQEIGYLREQWEQVLLTDCGEESRKVEAIKELNDVLTNMGEGYDDVREDLVNVQRKFLGMSLTPKNGENWVVMQIEKRWRDLFKRYPENGIKREKIWEVLGKLKRSLYFGKDPEVLQGYDLIPEELKEEWVRLIYGNADKYDPRLLERIIVILANPSLNIPSRERSKKTLTRLKALAETMNQLESNTNFALRQVLNGGDNGLVTELLGNMNLEVEES